jgi:hypothetical protein
MLDGVYDPFSGETGGNAPSGGGSNAPNGGGNAPRGDGN